MNLNKVILIGRVTQDPEVKTTPSGQSVANFGLATNRIWNDKAGQKQEQVEFHNIVVWRRLAEIAGQYAKKGALISIEGRLQTRSWQAQDGTNRYRTEVVAENLQLGPRAANAGGGNYSANTPKPMAPEAGQKEDVPSINLDETGEPIEEKAGNPGEPPSEVMPF